MIARLIRILRWIFTAPKSCDGPDCTEGRLCDDCAAFWAIK